MEIKKGVVLAGGNGTRLRPMTLVTNKHLLPVYDRPMIYYPLDNLVEAGVTEILIITGKEHCGDFISLLGSSYKSASLTYKVQEEADGIAGALKLAEQFINRDPFVVILGDNIYGENHLKLNISQPMPRAFGAGIFLKESSTPERFGVVHFEEGKILKIVEKPKEYISNWVVTGTYIFDYQVWDILKTLSKSARGEFEITDVLNEYIKKCDLIYCKLPEDFFWNDAGTIESLFKSSEYFYKKESL